MSTITLADISAKIAKFEASLDAVVALGTAHAAAALSGAEATAESIFSEAAQSVLSDVSAKLDSFQAAADAFIEAHSVDAAPAAPSAPSEPAPAAEPVDPAEAPSTPAATEAPALAVTIPTS
jgi:hypothetical protein